MDWGAGSGELLDEPSVDLNDIVLLPNAMVHHVVIDAAVARHTAVRVD